MAENDEEQQEPEQQEPAGVTVRTFAGCQYVVTSATGCTVTDETGKLDLTVEAGKQAVFVAVSGSVTVSDAGASVLPFEGAPVAVAGGGGSGGGGDCNVTITEKDSIECGTGATTQGSYNCISIGAHARTKEETHADTAIYSSSIALGYESEASNNSVAIGFRSAAFSSHNIYQGSYNVAVGADACAVCYSGNSTAIGAKAYASGAMSVALGYRARAEGYNSIALGSAATANDNCAVAVGVDANAVFGCTAIGYNARTERQFSTVLGDNAIAANESSLTVGSSSTTDGIRSCALGVDAFAAKPYSTAIGYGAMLTKRNTMAFSLGYRNGILYQFYFLLDDDNNGVYMPHIGFAAYDSLSYSWISGYKVPLASLEGAQSWSPANSDDYYSDEYDNDVNY